MTHTPAPWTKNEWENGSTDINIGAIGTPLIATVRFRDVSLNELEANARLIAAAPELLEALKDCHAHLPEGSFSVRVGTLIMKAEGK